MVNEDRTTLSDVVPSSSSQTPNNNQEAPSISLNWNENGHHGKNKRKPTAAFESMMAYEKLGDGPNNVNAELDSEYHVPKITFDEPSTSTQPLSTIADHSLVNVNPATIRDEDSSNIDVTTTLPSPDSNDIQISSAISNIPFVDSSPQLTEPHINDNKDKQEEPQPPASITKQLSALPISSAVLVTKSKLPTKRTYRRATSDPSSTHETSAPKSQATRRTRSKTTATTTQVFRNHLPTGYIYDVYMSYHATLDIFDIHPEDPRRLFYIYREMRTRLLLEHCERIPIKKATHQEILAVHTKELLRVLRKTKSMTRKELVAMESESDSIYVNNHSYEASLYAAGGVIELCKAVVADRVKNGFAIVRPPGHHAESGQSMGFCFINNVAIATKYCMERLGVQRIMIVDWDVHFGNGTHEIFADDPNVVYLSLHRYDEGWFYPADECGAIENVGEDPARGKCVNIAWPTDGTTDADYLHAFHHIVMPIGYEFKPDLVIVSAGFDAACGDSIGMCNVTPAGYGNMTHLLKSLANGRMVMALEGGYNLQATSISATACMSVLMGEAPMPMFDIRPSPQAIATVEKVKSVQRKYWGSL